MDNPPADWRGYGLGSQTIQLLRRTNFEDQLIADRLPLVVDDRTTKHPVDQAPRPKPSQLETTKPQDKPSIGLAEKENASFDLGIELEVEEAQRRLITKIDSAAIKARAIFNRVVDKSPPANKLPYIPADTKKNKEDIDHWWRVVFCDSNLRGLAGNCPIKPRNGHGLVYLYIVNNRVKYVGRTFYSLHQRMTMNQKDGMIGYIPEIKRNLLNAFRDEDLAIETEMVSHDKVNELEENTIRHFARISRIWNKDHNPYFEYSNYEI